VDDKDRDTGEAVGELSADQLVSLARERLYSALRMMGSGGDQELRDEAIVGAGILARDAADVLEALFEQRQAEREEHDG